METKILFLMCLCFYNSIKMQSISTAETTDIFAITTKIPKYTSIKTSTVKTTTKTTTTTTPLDCTIYDSDFLDINCNEKEGGNIVCQGGNVTKYPPEIDPKLSKSSDDHSVTFSTAIPGLKYNVSVCTTKFDGCKKCNFWPIERQISIDNNILANVTASNNSITIHCEAWKGKMLNASYHFEIMNTRVNFSKEYEVSWGEKCLVTFEDLKPGKVYNVSAFGRTFKGNDSSTISRAIVTKPEDIQLKCETKNLNSLTILVDDTTEVNYYKKMYKVHCNSETKNVESKTITLDQLKADTPYNATVQVELEEVDSKFGGRFKVISNGHTIECWTDLGAPKLGNCGTNGNIFTFQETSSSSMNISFPYIFEDTNGNITNVSLKVSKDSQLFNSYPLEVGGKEHCERMHYHLKDLPNAEYQVQLFASNRLNNIAGSPVGRFTISSTSTGLIVALTVIIILLILVIVILMCLMCRCKTTSSNKTVHMSKSSVNITRFINPNFTLRKISYRLSHHPVIRLPVKISNFSSYVENLEKDSGLMYSEEFDDLKSVGRNQTAEDALLQCNRAKNRFVNILPYDATRVKLQPIEDEEGSDYINANWIPGYNSKREYIATQGPLTSTMDDFWRLVWEHNCPAIVMLTLLVEKNKIKCEQYWPTESTSYGDLQVTLEGEIITEKWCLRKFKVENTATDESKIVKHFHYLEWPDMNVPEAESMLSFIHFIRENLKDEKSLETPAGPIVVHCSAGVGRSGTFIALETLLSQLEDEEDIDVYGTVMEMRKNRVQMVQTEQQYVFLYRCMKEVIEKSQPPGSSSSSCILQIHEAGTPDASNVITNVISGENDSSKDALIGNGKQAQESEKHKTPPSPNEQKFDETQEMQVKESGVYGPQGEQFLKNFDITI